MWIYILLSVWILCIRTTLTTHIQMKYIYVVFVWVNVAVWTQYTHAYLNTNGYSTHIKTGPYLGAIEFFLLWKYIRLFFFISMYMIFKNVSVVWYITLNEVAFLLANVYRHRSECFTFYLQLYDNSYKSSFDTK